MVTVTMVLNDTIENNKHVLVSVTGSKIQQQQHCSYISWILFRQTVNGIGTGNKITSNSSQWQWKWDQDHTRISHNQVRCRIALQTIRPSPGEALSYSVKVQHDIYQAIIPGPGPVKVLSV